MLHENDDIISTQLSNCGKHYDDTKTSYKMFLRENCLSGCWLNCVLLVSKNSKLCSGV